MKKLSVAALIIGAFVIYSFLHAGSSGAVLAPKTPTTGGSAASAATATATSAPPRPSPTATATVTTNTASSTPTPTPSPTATSAPPPVTPTPTATSGGLADGSYTGTVADAQWGYIQVKAVISQGKLTDVQFLQYPNDRSRSVYINSIADPELRTEAIQAQSAQVDIITGATDSSEAFIQSLSDALSQAGGQASK